jgi:hypothetical protein
MASRTQKIPLIQSGAWALWEDGTEIEEYTQPQTWEAGWETTMHWVTFDVY